MRVYVYRNLNKKCLSVRCVKTKKVIAHVDQIFISGAKFKVSKAGRDRVLREGQKNVHAGVEGEWIERSDFTPAIRVTYDPYKYDTFVEIETLLPVQSSEIAWVTTEGVYLPARRLL